MNSKNSTINNEPDLQAKKTGFGGWLYFFAIIFIWFSGISINYIINTLLPLLGSHNWQTLISHGNQLDKSMGQLIIYSELIINLFFIIFIFIITYAFIKKKKILKLLTISYLIINFIYALYAYFVYVPIPLVYEYSFADSITRIILALINCIIWIPYFIYSKRVKNTYIY